MVRAGASAAPDADGASGASGGADGGADGDVGSAASAQSLRKDGGEKVPARAARALAEVARGHAPNQSEVVACGGVAPLISLISRVTSGGGARDTSEASCEEEAAGVLFSLSHAHAANQQAVAQAGGLAALVHLAVSGTERGQQRAADALVAMCDAHVANTSAVADLVTSALRESAEGSEVREKAARVFARLARAGASHQTALAATGAVELLVSLLAPTKYEPPKPPGMLLRQQSSAGVATPPPNAATGASTEGDDTVEASAEDSAEAAARAAALAQRAEIQLQRRHLTQRELAGGLWALCRDNPRNQRDVAQAGGVPLLIAMLSDAPQIHRDAAGALWSLAADATNREMIATAGGIELLVELLKSRKTSPAQETVAGALHALAARVENQRAIAACGGIGLLIPLFESTANAATKAEGARPNDRTARDRRTRGRGVERGQGSNPKGDAECEDQTRKGALSAGTKPERGR